MDKTSGNALKGARLSSNYTQERAAEAIGCSVDAIRAWESGSRRPEVETVERLAIVYETKWLPQIYLRELSSGVLSETLPEFRPGVPLPQATLGVLDKLNKFFARHSDSRLISIGADGVIDAKERPEFDAIMADLGELARAYEELRYAKQDGLGP